jgi:hypothetical protein
MRKVIDSVLKTLVIVFGVLMLATNAALAQVSVSLPHIVARAGTTRTIDVMVGTLPKALSVISYQFNLSYDPSVILVIGSTMRGTISERAKVPVVEFSTPGVVKVAVATDSALTGSGALISFTVDMLAPGTSALTLSEFKFNEGYPSAALITDGEVIVPAFCVSLPVAQSVEVNQDSTWNIPITADAITGKEIFSYQFTVSFDSNKIEIIGVNTTGTSSSTISNILVNTTVAGQISVAAASSDTTAIAGGAGDTLLNLQAKVKPIADGTSALTFVNFQFNEGDPAVEKADGSVHVRDRTAIRVIDQVPTQYVLDQNYPNPFNPATMITFGLPNQTNVTLEVYNILGMKVRTLIAGARMNAVKYSVEWDGKDNSGMSVPSGIYLYRLHTDKFSAAKKMVLMK